MDFTDQQISHFQELYFKHFDERISKETAIKKGERLVRLVQTVQRAKREQLQNNH